MNSALAIVACMTVPEIRGQAVANLGWKDIKLIGPVFPGDTVYAESEILALRLSKSRTGRGIATVRTTGTKQDGSVFMTFQRNALLHSRKSARAGAANY